MPEQIQTKMNGVIPSIPVTTLAGIASLSDLLTEMPLPTPLPQTMSNKSLLFHPRVADEAQILLSSQDENLVPQLIMSLSQTSSDHIELKDNYANIEQPLEAQQNPPELLKAILQTNPHVFKGPQYNSPRNWPQQQSHQMTGNYEGFSPSYSTSSNSRQTPQDSPAHMGVGRTMLPGGIPHAQHPSMPVAPQNHTNVTQSSPFTVPSPSPRATVITEQTRTSTTPQHLMEDTHSFNNIPAQFDMHSPAHMSTPSPLISSLGNVTPQHLTMSSGLTPQHSMHMTPPTDSGLSATQHHQVQPQHHIQQQHPLHQQHQMQQQMNVHQQMFDPMMNRQLHQPQLTQALDIDHTLHDNQQFVLDQVTGLPDIDIPIGSLDASHSRDLMSNPMTGPQANVFDSVNTGANLNNAMVPLPDSAPPIPQSQQGHIPFQQTLHQQHHLQPTLQQHQAQQAFQVNQMQLQQAQQMQQQQQHLQHPQHQQQQVMQPNSNLERDIKISLKEPVIMLNRSLADQALMKKHLNASNEKSPVRATRTSLSSRDDKSIKSESDSEEEIGKNNKCFKSKAKDRQRDKSDKKKSTDEKRSSLARRKRLIDSDDEDEKDKKDEVFSPVKPKIRKFEKKLVPVLPKLSVEELMETNTYQRFNMLVETIFENTEEAALDEIEDDGDVPAELLINDHQLQALCSEAAKLKSLGAMESVPAEKLVRLLNILEKNIRDGARVSPLADPDDDAEQSRMWMQIAMSRVQQAVDASLVCLHIMTSSNMPKTIYLEDVIDRIIQFVKFQLQNTIYPSYDPVYRIDSKNKTENFNASGRKKRSHAKEVREKNMLMVFSKLNELVGLLSELLGIQILTDTSVLHASTLGVAPFFVENVNDLQLSALKLVTVIFTKYEKHRRLLLDDILASIARLPSSKHSLRTYRLSTDEHIQMLTALVLQLIQCVVVLPEGAAAPGSGEEQRRELSAAGGTASGPDVDVLILSKYDAAQRLAGNFLTAFLNKCGSKGEEVDYRPLFENFVQDLLATVNKPEWPAAELMLSLLGKLLVGHFSNKSSDMSLRVASIEYLGVVAARLRKDAVSSHCKLSTIDQIINDIKLEQSRDIEYDQVKDREIVGLSEPEERVVFLQKVLLDYLAVNGTKDSALGYARHFYLAQWYKDCAMEKQRVGQPKHVLSPSKKAARKRTIKKSGSRRRVISDDESELEQSEPEPIENDPDNEQKHSEIYRLIEERKRLIISKIRPYSSGAKADILQTYIDYNTAELITQYLASTRPFSQSFDRYLRDILCVLTESSIAIRTKAMKCLTMIVEADPSVLAHSDMALGVKHSFLDHSTSVREAAVDLVGKFVLSRPELIDKYYDILLARILDTGVSVRKRVIKILKDICMEFPDYEKIPEICVKMIRRVNDEEGIRKLVMEVFQNMWFTPIKERPSLDTKALLRKVMNITDVVAACKDIGLEWFEQLLVSLFKPKEDKEDSTKLVTEPPKALLTACTQIVDCLIENVLRLEETEMPSPELSADEPGPPATLRRGASQRLVACLTTLYLFAKIRPQLLVNHAITLQPYLSLKCQTQGDYQIISSVAHTLELVVPLMEHPSETFLAQLEEDSVKLILQHDRSVVASCVSCLGSIVNSVTRNYKLIRDCFKKYYDFITTYKKHYEINPESQWLARNKPFFRRALFTVGLLLRHFDFTDPQVIEGLEPDIKDQVFNTLNFFVTQDNDDTFTLSAIGSLCIRHYEFMMLPQLEELYHYFLTSDIAPVQMRIQVLKNIELYLAEEEKRMIKQDLEWAKMSKKENLKEMGDVSSGMASAVIQRYLKQILESFLHANINVRHSALKVIQLILAQGLVHPVTIVPYLICMSTDCETMVSHSADKQLQEIEKKYPGFVHTKAQVGIKLSFRLQQILQKESRLVRGMRTKEGEYPTALNGFLYTILRNTKQQRRAIVQSFLKQFDESVKTSLSQLLYLADNLAYFSYQVQDEPLFIIHHIDIIISMSGTNLLQDFKKALIPKENSSNQAKQETAQQPTVHGDQQPPPQEQQQQQQQQEQEHQFQQPLPQQQQYPYPQPPLFYPQGGDIPLPNEIAGGMPSGGLAYQEVLHPTHLPLGQERPQQIQQLKSSLLGPDGRPRPDQLLAVIEDEEDDEEDEESVLQRLPQDTRILRQYITASQGFLLLLNLRQHLKDLYGFSDAKISQYSPSESAKVYEKAVNRKNNQMFKPKNTLQRLKENKNDEQELDEQGRQQLVKEYLDFKQLVLKFDPDEPEEEDEEGGGSKSKRGDHENSKIANSSEPDRTADGAALVQYQVHQVTEHPNNSMTQAQGPPRVPKLTIHASHHPASTEKEHHRKHRTHKTEKPKKHKKKKRRRLSDSSDSAEDCSDPDYHA